MLVTKKWFRFPKDKKSPRLNVSPTSCRNRSNTQRLIDRYVMLKYTEQTPLYDERFVNYGYNKIQFIEQLKYYR